MAQQSVKDASGRDESLGAQAQAGLAASELINTIKGDPASLEAVRALLSACSSTRKEASELIKAVEGRLASAGALPVQPISSVVELLVKHGALAETLEIDGAPYEGTIEDAFEDESISDESQSLIYVETTDAGRIAARALEPRSRAAALFEEEPDLIEGFLVVLSECDTRNGRSTKELEAALDERGLLLRDARTNVPTVYGSMFANMLKDAGCLEWRHTWITTDVGREALKAAM